MSNHIIITRFHYQKNDPRFEWRFAYYQAMVLARLQAQTDSDFHIGIWCYDHHRNLFEKLDKRIITFKVSNTEEKYKSGNNGRLYYYDFASWDQVEGLRRYAIQSGLDSDDLVSFDYIATINRVFATCKYKTHLSFQPELFDLKTFKIKPIGQSYTNQKGSAFMSLYQPNDDDYHFIYDRSHLTLGQVAKHSLVLPVGKCWATAHHLNESTGRKC